jgi:hypothetical protein
MTGADAVPGEVRRQPVGSSNQLRMAQPAMAVAHREGLRRRRRVPRGQVVDRLLAPEAASGIGGNGRRIQQS